MDPTSVANLDELLKGRHFDHEIIVLCVRRYLRYTLIRLEPENALGL
jgi:transposase-like protein